MVKKTIQLDPARLSQMEAISALMAKCWPGVSGKLSRDGEVWYICTNGYAAERLGSTMEEIEAYMKANPKTEAGEIGKFVNMLENEIGFGGITFKRKP